MNPTPEREARKSSLLSRLFLFISPLNTVNININFLYQLLRLKKKVSLLLFINLKSVNQLFWISTNELKVKICFAYLLYVWSQRIEEKPLQIVGGTRRVHENRVFRNFLANFGVRNFVKEVLNFVKKLLFNDDNKATRYYRYRTKYRVKLANFVI